MKKKISRSKLVFKGLVTIQFFFYAQYSFALTPNSSSVFSISGGGSPSSNHLRYYTNIARVHTAYKGVPISNFIATGSETDKVTMAYEKLAIKNPKNGSTEVIDKILLDSDGLPVLAAQKAEGGIQGAASLSAIRKGLEEWAMKNPKTPDDEPIIFYVTDHGTQVATGGAVALWNKTNFNATELNEILNVLPENKKVIMLYDQCYGGDMLKAIWDKNGKVRKNTCGIAAASPGQLAYSGGGVMRNLNLMIAERMSAPVNRKRWENKEPTFMDLYRKINNDTTIVSSPSISSDVFANEWFKKNFSEDIGSNIVGQTLIEPKNQCFSRFDFTNMSPSKSLAPELLLALRKNWQELNRSFSQLGSPLESLDNLNEQLTIKKAALDKSFSDFNDYLAKTYNPHYIQLFKDNYKSYPVYLTLKEKLNKGENLSEIEKQALQNHQQEMEFMKAAIKDESLYKLKGYSMPYKHDPSKETMKVNNNYNIFSSKKTKAINDYFKTQKKISLLTTLNALEQMVQKNDTEAINSYLNIKNCENTNLLK